MNGTKQEQKIADEMIENYRMGEDFANAQIALMCLKALRPKKRQAVLKFLNKKYL